MSSPYTKPLSESKTLWVNGLAALVTISTAFGLDLGLDAEAQTAIVGGVMALVNVWLRLVTNTQLV